MCERANPRNSSPSFLFMENSRKRKTIPEELSADILYESDRICCVCHQPGLAVQIHHIDGDHSNNAPHNLAVLCLEDHARVSSKSTMGKGISPTLLTKYRNEWCQVVRSRREALVAKPTIVAGSPDAYIEALACHEVRKISFHMDSQNWSSVEKCLDEIAPYPASWHYGDQLRSEVLDILYSLACSTRHEMPESVASQIESIASAALPIASLVAPAHKLPSEEQIHIFQSALSIGFSLAHDAVKYLKNHKVMFAGTHLLRKVLRYSHLNKLEELKKETLGRFEHLLEVAGYANDEYAKEWIIFDRDDALALDGDPLPKMPGSRIK